jgi:hypothetical protein
MKTAYTIPRPKAYKAHKKKCSCGRRYTYQPYHDEARKSMCAGCYKALMNIPDEAIYQSENN